MTRAPTFLFDGYQPRATGKPDPAPPKHATSVIGRCECSACGKPKPPDRFRACETCRAEWRRHSRKPGGPAETIEALRAENARLRARLEKLSR